jgi:hypothetical protein
VCCDRSQWGWGREGRFNPNKTTSSHHHTLDHPPPPETKQSFASPGVFVTEFAIAAIAAACFFLA